MDDSTVKNEVVYSIKRILLFDAILLLISLIGLFFGRFDIPLGFILGAAIAIINYLLIIQFTKTVMVKEQKIRLYYFFSYLFRYLIYGLGLALGIILEKCGYRIFAWYTIFIGYLTVKIVLIFINKKQGGNL